MSYKVFILSILVLLIPQLATSQDTFTISTSYQNLLSDSEEKGMLDRILVEAFRRIGRIAEIVYTPTAKSILDVNAGLLDAEVTLGKLRIFTAQKDLRHEVFRGLTIDGMAIPVEVSAYV
jgi:hypothetical protein